MERSGMRFFLHAFVMCFVIHITSDKDIALNSLDTSWSYLFIYFSACILGYATTGQLEREQ